MYLYLFLLYECFAFKSVCQCVSGPCGGQKRALYFLEQELQWRETDRQTDTHITHVEVRGHLAEVGSSCLSCGFCGSNPGG